MKKLKIEMEQGYMVGSDIKYPIIKDEDDQVIGMCLTTENGYAQLFATAPDMLDALKELIEWADHYAQTAEDGILPFNISIHNAKAVVAQAEGRQK